MSKFINTDNKLLPLSCSPSPQSQVVTTALEKLLPALTIRPIVYSMSAIINAAGDAVHSWKLRKAAKVAVKMNVVIGNDVYFTFWKPEGYLACVNWLLDYL